jgi:hypothetical protein
MSGDMTRPMELAGLLSNPAVKARLDRLPGCDRVTTVASARRQANCGVVIRTAGSQSGGLDP